MVTESSALRNAVTHALPSAAVGVLVARRQPRNPIGWLLLGIAATTLLSTCAGAYSLLVYRLGRDLPLGTLGLMLYQLWSPALALFLLVILLFPDGGLPSRRWRWVVWAYSLLCGSYLALLIGVAADAISGHQIRVDDAYGGLTVVDYPTGQFAVAQDVILLLILALGLCFAGSQLVSWRHSSGDQRQQLKWLMFGFAICVICAGLSIPGQKITGRAAPIRHAHGVVERHPPQLQPANRQHAQPQRHAPAFTRSR
jgi:hypothetical protein